MLNEIFLEDCLKGMKRIPDGSVDAIICDLPYGVLNSQSEGGGWDCQIPLGPLWEQYLRVAKEDAAIVLFCQGMFTARLMTSQPKLWRYNLVWDKLNTTGFLNANRMPLRAHEDIAVFYRRQPTYNPQMTVCQEWGRNHSRGRNHKSPTNRCYGSLKKTDTVLTDLKYPTSIIQVQKERPDAVVHPTQKPVDLLRWLVLTYTNEGETVLDNCSGSGTTAVAAWREKRNFICFEKDPVYWEMSVKRLENEKANLKLF